MYKNIIKQLLLTATVGIAGCITASAQTAAHRILELNPDVASLALGGTHLVTKTQNYLYANPTKVFDIEKTLTINGSGEYFAKFKDMKRESFGSISAAYRLNDKHALFAGFRKLSGLKIARVNEVGQEVEDQLLRPAQMTFDAGYAFSFSDHLSAFATVSMLRSNTGRQSQSLFAGLGMSYTHTFDFLGKGTHFEATLAGYNLGEDVEYDKNISYRLPSTVALGLGATMELNTDHSLGLQAQGARVTSYSETQIGAGVEYIFRKKYALRGGYQHYNKDVSFTSVGLGWHIGHLTLEAAYRIGMGEYTKNSAAFSISINI